VSHITEANKKKITAPSIRARKGVTPIVALTAYDYPSARLVDEAGFDIILVGDSLANTVLGYDTTLPVTLEEMIAAARAVRRGAKTALVVGDMPFGTYHDRSDRAVHAAIKYVKTGGVDAIKIEGGANRAHIVKAIVAAEIPVMAHIGLTPQSVLRMGGYKVQGKSMEAARELLEDALAVERAGAFSVVLEGIPAEISRIITERVSIPTIGIGAGPSCDGQILVFTDLVGLTFGHKAKFVREYANLKGIVSAALSRFAEDVSKGQFPAPQESYHLPDGIELEPLDEESQSMPPLGPIN
jgi:3-methyl-2-oxobutanoate hydroxymethyltransferase